MTDQTTHRGFFQKGFFKCISLLSVLSIFLGPALPYTANARTNARFTQVNSPSTDFRGSKVEFVAYLMPQVLAKAGEDVRVADLALASALKKEFGGSSAFLWQYSLVKSFGKGLEFSVTLPSDEGRLRQGTVALGLISDGKLAGAYVVTMNRDGLQNKLQLTMTTPAGAKLSDLNVALDKDGKMLLSPAELKALVSAMAINTHFGLLEKLIALLEKAQDLLYWVRDLLNMAICIVDEVIELVYDWMGCGLGSSTPGGGVVVDVVVCTVGATIEIVNEIFSRCL